MTTGEEGKGEGGMFLYMGAERGTRVGCRGQIPFYECKGGREREVLFSKGDWPG